MKVNMALFFFFLYFFAVCKILHVNFVQSEFMDVLNLFTVF